MSQQSRSQVGNVSKPVIRNDDIIAAFPVTRGATTSTKATRQAQTKRAFIRISLLRAKFRDFAGRNRLHRILEKLVHPHEDFAGGSLRELRLVARDADDEAEILVDGEDGDRTGDGGGRAGGGDEELNLRFGELEMRGKSGRLNRGAKVVDDDFSIIIVVVVVADTNISCKTNRFWLLCHRIIIIVNAVIIMICNQIANQNLIIQIQSKKSRRGTHHGSIARSEDASEPRSAPKKRSLRTLARRDHGTLNRRAMLRILDVVERGVRDEQFACVSAFHEISHVGDGGVGGEGREDAQRVRDVLGEPVVVRPRHVGLDLGDPVLRGGKRVQPAIEEGEIFAAENGRGDEAEGERNRAVDDRARESAETRGGRREEIFVVAAVVAV